MGMEQGVQEGEERETFDPNSGPRIRPVDRGRSRIRAHVATPSAAAILPIRPSPGHRLRHLPATGRVQRVVQGLIAQHRTGHRQ